MLEIACIKDKPYSYLEVLHELKEHRPTNNILAEKKISKAIRRAKARLWV